MDFFSSLEANIKGTLGESITNAVLYHLCINGYKGTPFHNIYLPKGNGEYSEIDLAFVTTKGIFVFECKNYSGWIFGSHKDKYWTVSFPNGQKKQFYNPIIQNQSHINVLRKIYGKDIPCFSIVVFSDKSTLKKIDLGDSYAQVVRMDSLFDVVSRAWPNTPDVLSEERVNEICESMKSYTHVSSSVKKEHINSINAKKQEIEKHIQNKENERRNKINSMDIMDIVSSTFRR